jgi:hypothetical protein
MPSENVGWRRFCFNINAALFGVSFAGNGLLPLLLAARGVVAEDAGFALSGLACGVFLGFTGGGGGVFFHRIISIVSLVPDEATDSPPGGAGG